jgi:MSHA biogenesis protein MshM
MSVLYLDHFNLKTDPFRITPDTDFFFSGGQRGDILEGLVVASMHDEGIVTVVGEIGMGKTMLSRMLLDRLRQLPADTVYLANPVFDRDEILAAIARDLMHAPPEGNRGQTLAALESVLIERYSQDRRVVVVVDEAHSMPSTTLEEIRLLSNLETSQNKLLKIVLFGQPELDGLLDAPQLRQVKDRVSHRFELQPLNAAEASAYLMFRLHKAGWQGGELFDAKALALLVQASEGRTRKLNMLADKSMLAAYAEGVPQVGVDQVRRAVGDSLPSSQATHSQPALSPASPTNLLKKAGLAAVIFAGVAVAIGLGYALGRTNNQNTPQTNTGVAPVTPLPSREVASPQLVAASSVQPPTQAINQPITQPTAIEVSAPKAPVTSSPIAPTTPEALATSATAVTLAQPKAPSNNGSYSARLQATNAFIAQPSSTGFTVQLLSQAAPHEEEVLSAAQSLDNALKAAALLNIPVLMHDRLYKNQLSHALYVGHFGTRAAAMQFIESAPAEVKRYKPMIRSLDAIRKEPAP